MKKKRKQNPNKTLHQKNTLKNLENNVSQSKQPKIPQTQTKIPE